VTAPGKYAVTELTHDDVQKILAIIDGMGDRDVHLEIGDLKVHVTRGQDAARTMSIPPAPAPPATPERPLEPAAQPAGPPPAAEVPAGLSAVRAPTIGTFYRAGSPGAKPYVEVGDRVGPDDTVGVFEVMKLFSSLNAGVAGTVAAIPAANESLVAEGQPLVLIRPD
jgi:acetyl-CoA carboxylase biotin carboxyl carrier protein